MNRKQRIKNILLKNFNNFSFNIVDNSHLHSGHNNFTGYNETHIKVVLLVKTKEKINRLEIHRKINELLQAEFENGLHALEIKIN